MALGKALVTGAGGFIGSHLVEALVKEGYGVRAIVHYNALNSWGNLEYVPKDVLESIEVVETDIREEGHMRELIPDIEVVFHLAALISIPYSYIAPHQFVDINVRGTLSLLNACRLSSISRFIHVSTSEVYGTAREVPMNENHPLNPQSPYAASKLAGELLSRSFFHTHGVPVVVVRPFNTYGPRQSARAIIPTIVTQALSGPKIHLGNTDTARDLTYVIDTVAGLICAARSDGGVGAVFNLGNGYSVSVGELVRIVGQDLGIEAEIETDPCRIRPEMGEVRNLVADATQAKAVLTWEPRVQLKQGIAATTKWVRCHLDGYKPRRFNI
ncbi:MAG: GDP-mannose 4,6-dehydratase [Armatimonadetes bacterium]|nr:GDP-mannose 4,6-dehydratase [Armatimonadota bacterium]